MCHCSSRALVPSSTHWIGSVDKSYSLKRMGAPGGSLLLGRVLQT